MCHAMADLDGHLHRAVAAVQNASEKKMAERGNNQDINRISRMELKIAALKIHFGSL